MNEKRKQPLPFLRAADFALKFSNRKGNEWEFVTERLSHFFKIII